MDRNSDEMDNSDDSSQAGESEIDEQVTQIEETRAEMSDTIDAIQQRLSPELIREQASDAVREATVGQAERIVDDANQRARQAASGMAAVLKQHPVEMSSVMMTVVATGVVLIVRARSRHAAEVKRQEEASASRGQTMPAGLRSFRAWMDRQGEQWGAVVPRDGVTYLQRAIDANRGTLAAVMDDIGLTAAARITEAKRKPSGPMRNVSGMMKSRWMIPIVLAPAAAGAWVAQRLMRNGPQTGQDLLLMWLNDAYGMENALLQTLQNHARDAGNYPQMQAKLDQHLAQTRRHAEMVKRCIDRLGGHTSAVKTTLGSITGRLQGLSTSTAADEVVKDALADFAAENFEIASYTALIAAAEQLGDRETAVACGQILREEQEMARWLEENLPATTRETMNRLTESGR